MLKFEIMASTAHDLACIASLTSSNTYTKGKQRGTRPIKELQHLYISENKGGTRLEELW
jgi:hypothetical protein